MIKSRIVKSALLVSFVGILLISLVEPISGNSMGQGKMMGQRDTMNNHAENQTQMMHCMMHHCMMEGEHSANGTMMHCMMTGEHSDNETMMACMMMGLNASTPQSGPDCTRFWLQKAIMLHDLHMKVPSTMTKESNMLLMDQMKQAYECNTGEKTKENMTMGMMDQNANTMKTNQDCTSVSLKKAMALHDLHMKDSKAAANESSQMELMNHMIRAYDYIPINKTTKGTNLHAGLAQARLHCADFWLQKAIEMHELHLKDPGTATEESQMEMMDHMMRAAECIKGQKMTTGMTDTTEGHTSGGH